MLACPNNGILQSTTSDNLNNILCDWIEGSILFDENLDALSVMDVAKVLTAENIYEEQDFAVTCVEAAWNELKRRLSWIGSEIPFSVTRSRVKRTNLWQDTPAHSFCVLVSLAQYYEGWSEAAFGSDYNEQGELFELLTQESFKKQFSDWKVKRTGWSRTQPTNLYEAVDQIADWLGRDTRGNINKWADSSDKDAGLDLLCYRPFPDKRAGFPVYLMQCTSSRYWTRKVYEPSIDFWQELVEFVVRPQKAFAIPFALDEDNFRRQCVGIQGLFLDRYRLLAAARYCKQWESSSLKERIIKWAEPKIDQLPWN